jgi:hypothetical protein
VVLSNGGGEKEKGGGGGDPEKRGAHEDDDSYYITKARQLVTLSLRNQYWELDRYCRGRSIYQRHGNAVGNGLVMVRFFFMCGFLFTYAFYFIFADKFVYPGALPPQDEWEIRGHEGSKEELERECGRLRSELVDAGRESLLKV